MSYKCQICNKQYEIDLGATFCLIQELRQGIKQTCDIIISDNDVNVSNRGLCIIIQTKNYKTKEPIYFQRTITEKELIETPGNLHSSIVNHIITDANGFFKGGGSWSPDSCPKCKRADNVVPFKKLTIEQKATAIRTFDRIWKEKWGYRVCKQQKI